MCVLGVNINQMKNHEKCVDVIADVFFEGESGGLALLLKQMASCLLAEF
jgi:hypothetical protein